MATIRILNLADHAPTLPAGGDVADVLADETFCGLTLGDAAEPADVGRLIDSLAGVAPVVETPKPDTIEPAAEWRPFPVEVLPEPLRSFVTAAAAAIGCDASFLVLPLLAAVASAIGNARTIQLKKTWQEPAVLWVAIVGWSGTLKSPAIDLALSFLRKRQAKAFKTYAAELEQYAQHKLLYDADLRKWQQSGRTKGEPPPEKLREPVCWRGLVNNITLEALVARLADNPKGLLAEVDELAGLLRSFDRYRDGKGGDSAAWLSMHRAGAVTVDRKTAARPVLYIPRAAVSLCGGIQPAILRACIGREHAEDGLLARILFCFPPAQRKQWRDATVDHATLAAVDDLFGRLLELSLGVYETYENAEEKPVVVTLTREAKLDWVRFYNEHAAELAGMEGDLAACWSKLEGYAARLALVVQLARDPDAAKVDAEAVAAGIALARWFGNEARRVYQTMGETDEQREQRRLADWVRARGGHCTIREAQQGCRWLPEAEAAELALAALVKAGVGRWEPIEPTAKGGRPSRVFSLVSTSTQPHESRENDSSVDVDSVDSGQNGHAAPEDINTTLATAAETDAEQWGDL